MGDTPLDAPRILCLHGGGTNGAIMRLQCRTITRDLSPQFRLVFPDAPFFCPPHPNVIPVYEDYGPYRRWLRWQTSQPAVDDDTVIEEIHYQMRTAMEEDDRQGGSGEWVGLLGFSQGAKMVATLLYESQLRMDDAEQANGHMSNGTTHKQEPIEGFAGGKWRFGVCMAGRPPLVSLRDHDKGPEGLQRPGDMSELGKVPFPAGMDRLRVPTIHVLGLADEGLQYNRQLLHEFCEPSTTKTIEWDGDHRLPFKTVDVAPVVEAIVATAKEEGVVFKSKSES